MVAMRQWPVLLGATLMLALAPAAGFGQGTAAKLSPAQAALFASDHLHAITKPAVLHYAFRHDGGAAARYSDTISLEIKAVHADGKKDVAVAFLSGPRHLPFAPVTDFNGNPLLMYFLQYDVMSMQRATGGDPSFFRNRIRDAFLDGAEMHPVTLTLDGKQAAGTEIVIHPYAKLVVPALARYTGKSYSFVLSAAVPGMLYSIASLLPESGKEPAVTESATFVSEGP